MNHESQENEHTSHEDQDVLKVVKKIQQQLAYLEKKIDMLLNQGSGPRPYKSDAPFSHRPNRSFGHGEGRGHGRERNFRDRESRDFGASRRSFDRPHSGGSGQGGPGGGGQGGERGFPRRKKRFFRD